MIVAIGDIIACVCFTTFAIVFVVLRSIGRFYILKRHGWEDIIILGALVCSICDTVSLSLMCAYGAGQPEDIVSQAVAIKIRQTFFAQAISYALGLSFVKVSILVQYLRLCITQIHKTVCRTLITYNALYTIVSMISFLASCRPIPYFWDKQIPGGNCNYNTVSWYLNAACDIISDVTLCLFPVMLLKSLTIPRGQKFALILVFALGGAGCITAIIRLRSLMKTAQSLEIVRYGNTMGLWSSGELNVGIGCACLPTLRPVFAKIFPSLASSDTKHVRNTARENGISTTKQSIFVENSISFHEISLEDPSLYKEYTK